jgi:hypothetical protein
VKDVQASYKEEVQVKIFDPALNQMFDVKGIANNFSSEGVGFGPTTCRINYSIVSTKFKAYMYGGLDEKNNVLGSLEVFNAIEYKFA